MVKTFIPRSVEEIVNDMLNYIFANTTVTDGNVGSVIRTIVEAAALEDAEQYSQAANILFAFFLANAKGTDLDERAAEYDVARKLPSPSIGTVQFLDTQLRRTFLSNSVTAPSTVLNVVDASIFPTGAITLRLGEGSTAQEDVTVSTIDTSSNTIVITAPGAQFDHPAAATTIDEIDNLSSMVSYVSGNADRVIQSGVTLRARPSSVLSSVAAVTTEAGVHPNGNFASSAIKVVTTTIGSNSAVPEKRLTHIVGNPPFNGANVINTAALSGGFDIETDPALRNRIRNTIASLSRGTLNAILGALLDVVDSTTAQRVARANLVEDFGNETVYAYIDDGTTSYVPDKNLATLDTLAMAYTAGGGSIEVENAADFPTATISDPRYIILNSNNAAGNGTLETEQYQSITDNVVTLVASGSANHPLNTQIAVPEVITTSSDADRKYYTLSAFPITGDSTLIYKVTSDLVTTTLLTEDTHYILNRSNGQLEFLDGEIPATGSIILASYNNYINLIQTAQKVIDGDLTDPINFPGYRSAGIKVYIREVEKVLIEIILDVTFDPNVTDLDTVKFVSEQLTISYVTGLNVGDDVILMEIIDRLASIAGVTDVQIISPSGNIAIPHDSIAVVNSVLVA